MLLLQPFLDNNMAIGLAIFATIGAVHLGIREYNKRLAQKDGYDILEHDNLWRPLEKKGGKRLNKKEARSLAKRKRREFGGYFSS